MTGLAGTGELLRLALRRDRILLPVGVVAVVATIAGSARATLDLYPPGSTAIDGLAEIFRSPTAVAMYGRLPDPVTIGSVAVIKAQLMATIILILVAVAIVRRHTRADEETGRLELLGSTVMGRRAPLAAAVLLASAFIAVTAALSGLSLVGVGLETRGSLALALGWLGLGLASVGIAAVAAQLSGSARGMSGLVGLALGLTFLLRMIADSRRGLEWLSWLTPWGWNTRVQAYGANRVGPVVVALVATAALLSLAVRLLDRRDEGAGLLHERPGRAVAAPRLGHPIGLALRLDRGALIGWSLGVVLLGVVAGSLAGSIEDLLSDPTTLDMLRRMGGSGAALTDIYFGTYLRMVSLAVAGFAVSVVLRARGEEEAGRAEPLLATRVGRMPWLGSHLTVAVAGSAALLLLVGLVMGAVAALIVDDSGLPLHLAAAALAQLPAVLVLAGLASVVVGVLPRWTALAWALLGILVALTELGSFVGLPDALVSLSPWSHLAVLPGQDLRWAPVIIVTGVAAILAAAGMLGFRRRDVPA